MAVTNSLANTSWNATNDDKTTFQLNFGPAPTSLSVPGTGTVINLNNGVSQPMQWGETPGTDGEPLFVVSVNQWLPANGWWIGKHTPGGTTGSGYGLWNPTIYTHHALQAFSMTLITTTA